MFDNIMMVVSCHIITGVMCYVAYKCQVFWLLQYSVKLFGERTSTQQRWKSQTG